MDKREILFRNFQCNGDEFCDCYKCMELDEYQVLESMTEEELMLFANETFGVMMNKHMAHDGMVEMIMDMYELSDDTEEIHKANKRGKEFHKYAKNG